MRRRSLRRDPSRMVLPRTVGPVRRWLFGDAPEHAQPLDGIEEFLESTGLTTNALTPSS